MAAAPRAGPGREQNCRGAAARPPSDSCPPASPEPDRNGAPEGGSWGSAPHSGAWRGWGPEGVSRGVP